MGRENLKTDLTQKVGGEWNEDGWGGGELRGKRGMWWMSCWLHLKIVHFCFILV